jgi:hypothetical protein
MFMLFYAKKNIVVVTVLDVWPLEKNSGSFLTDLNKSSLLKLTRIS